MFPLACEILSPRGIFFVKQFPQRHTLLKTPACDTKERELWTKRCSKPSWLN